MGIMDVSERLIDCSVNLFVNSIFVFFSVVILRSDPAFLVNRASFIWLLLTFKKDSLFLFNINNYLFKPIFITLMLFFGCLNLRV